MRLIGTLNNENSARRIVSFLKEKGIESHCDISFDAQTGQMTYQLWILDEDKIGDAAVDFERFQREPSNAEFDAPVALRLGEEEEPPPPQTEEDEEKAKGFAGKKAHLTMAILIVCAAVFFLNFMQLLNLRQAGLKDVFMMTPIQLGLLYDVPPPLEALEELIENRIRPGEKGENLGPEVEARIGEIQAMPAWRGIYDWIVLKAKGEDTSQAVGPLFVKIREGEFWRLFTPCLLHSDFLHILFNMIWLWVLGRPIEQRIGLGKTALLTVAAGVSTNTIQYLMSGPFFIGYSGVIMALAGFIWMRERIAPWEGYPLNRTTILFLLLFVGSMLLLSFVSFFFQMFTAVAFAPNIANTAHIAGAIIGAMLGRLSFFSQRAKAL